MGFGKFSFFFKADQVPKSLFKLSNCTFVDFTEACQALISHTIAGTKVIIETAAVCAGRSLKQRFRYFLLFPLVVTTKLLEMAQKSDRDSYKY